VIDAPVLVVWLGGRWLSTIVTGPVAEPSTADPPSREALDASCPVDPS
jgi:hypothetical protein